MWRLTTSGRVSTATTDTWHSPSGSGILGPMSDDAETDSADFVPTPIERLNTALSGQHEIEDELGEGGMASVGGIEGPSGR